MSTSYPYLTLARERGLDHGRVLSYVDWLDGSLPGWKWRARDALDHLSADDTAAIVAARDAEMERRRDEGAR